MRSNAEADLKEVSLERRRNLEMKRSKSHGIRHIWVESNLDYHTRSSAFRGVAEHEPETGFFQGRSNIKVIGEFVGL